MNNKNKIWGYKIWRKFNKQLFPWLHEIIIGLMLGDLSAEKLSYRHNTRLQFVQSFKNWVYIEHLYSLFNEFCGTEPRNYSWYDARPNKMKTYKSTKFKTLSLPCFNIYWELFYNEQGKKFIDKNLQSMITAKSLAYWFMDDGYKVRHGYFFCTECFNYEQNIYLSTMLNEKFDLKSSCRWNTNGYRLFVRGSSREKFLGLIEPYILDHFKYKL